MTVGGTTIIPCHDRPCVNILAMNTVLTATEARQLASQLVAAADESEKHPAPSPLAIAGEDEFAKCGEREDPTYLCTIDVVGYSLNMREVHDLHAWLEKCIHYFKT